MPPRPKISEIMVVNAALKVARRDGHQRINARSVAKELNCSTQPIMYHFQTIDDLKSAALERIARFHRDYILDIAEGQNPLIAVSLNYIRFAAEEKNLFRFLFDAEGGGRSLPLMIQCGDIRPLTHGLPFGTDVSDEVLFDTAVLAHGWASVIARGDCEFDEDKIARSLENALRQN